MLSMFSILLMVSLFDQVSIKHRNKKKMISVPYINIYMHTVYTNSIRVGKCEANLVIQIFMLLLALKIKLLLATKINSKNLHTGY